MKGPSRLDDNICHEHTGCVARIEELEKQKDFQWEEINGMKKLAFILLGTLLLNSVGVIATLAVLLVE